MDKRIILLGSTGSIGTQTLDVVRMHHLQVYALAANRNIQLLEQQCIKYGHLLIRVGKWFPSSKTCISCGYIHRELKLNDRLYVCPECGNAMDRDHQAALNIKKEAVRILAEEYSAGKECGWKPVSLEGLMEELRERTLLYA